MTRRSGEARLVSAAADAREGAYAPYSGFKVGAALATRDGQTVTGCNVENASYGLTICAERVAVFSAVARGLRAFDTIAICGAGGPSPCGACRQVLHEFSPQLVVLRCEPNGAILARHVLSKLLPYSLDPSHLDKE